jgi:hypothetical protein
MVKDAINTSDKKRNALTEIDSNAETSSSDEKWSDGESYDSGDTENIPHHSTTKKKRSEFNMCCCSLFFIFQISPTSSFIGKKQAASARVSESPTVELPPIVELPATALVSSGELVQGHPKDDSVYLASDDSDAPRRTMRIRKTTSRYGLESHEDANSMEQDKESDSEHGSDEDANSMEQDEESDSEHGSDEDAYSMEQDEESDSEPTENDDSFDINDAKPAADNHLDDIDDVKPAADNHLDDINDAKPAADNHLDVAGNVS